MSKKHSDTIQKQFAKTVEAFSKFAVRDTPEMLEERLSFAKLQPEDSLLDVACGPGAFVLAAAPKVKFARGTDLTAAMLRQARTFQSERGIMNAFFDRAEAEHLPYPDSVFDLVTCQFAIHHMLKPRIVLKEMVRVLKPGGRLYLVDTVSPESDAKHELHNRIEFLRDASHTESQRLTSFLAMFEEANLQIARQALRRRERSFDQWMLRAGLEPQHKRYQEARRLLEESAEGDRAGFSPKPQDGDIAIIHIEGMFIAARADSEGTGA
jgi:ubiquinone/menaquinone biosynthesis C-methylase UbiE